MPENERTVDLYTINPSKDGSSSTASGNSSSSNRVSGTNQAQRQDHTSIHRLFLDPSGRHVIVSTLSGENYYFFSGWDHNVKRARPLSKTRGMVINAVSWNSPLAQSSAQVAVTTTSTKEILLGDLNGNIYESVIDASADRGDDTNAAAAALRSLGRGGNLERHFRLVYSLTDKNSATRTSRVSSADNYAITGIRSEIWSGTSSTSGVSVRKRAVVLVTTNSRIYQFVGTVPSAAANVSLAERDEGGMYDDLFKVYKDVTPSEYGVDALLFRRQSSEKEEG